LLRQAYTYPLLPHNNFFLLLYDSTERTERAKETVFHLLAFDAEMVADFSTLEGLVSAETLDVCQSRMK
jgi:hypothetical protein